MGVEEIKDKLNNAEEFEVCDKLVVLVGRKPPNGATMHQHLSFQDIQVYRKNRVLGPMRVYPEGWVPPHGADGGMDRCSRGG